LNPPEVTLKQQGVKPDTIGVRDPETVFVEVGVSDEMFPAPSSWIEAVGEAAEGSDRHSAANHMLRFAIWQAWLAKLWAWPTPL
jgi:hypothetical protein